jgi:hypothetical protein
MAEELSFIQKAKLRELLLTKRLGVTRSEGAAVLEGMDGSRVDKDVVESFLAENGVGVLTNKWNGEIVYAAASHAMVAGKPRKKNKLLLQAIDSRAPQQAALAISF